MTNPSEAPAAMQFKEENEITVMRGLHKGKTATVKGVDAAKEQYMVKFSDGSFAVVNAVNVRTPEEPSITATQLGAALGNYGNDIPTEVMEALEAAVPGITERVVISRAVA